jgi:PAS domain S-box-containing protein
VPRQSSRQRPASALWTRRFGELLRAITDVAAVLETDAIAELVVARACELVAADAADLGVVDDGGAVVRWRHVSDGDRTASDNLRLDARSIRSLATRRTPLVVSDTAATRWQTEPVASAGLRSFIATALPGDSRAVGALIVGRHRRSSFDAYDKLVVSSLARQVAVSLQNAEVFTRARISADHLQRLIESSGDGIITADVSGRIVSWNAGAQAIYGWTAGEAIGQVLPMVPADGREDAGALLVRVLTHGQMISNYETERLRKDGQRIPVMVTVSPIRNTQGEIVALLGISKDMSARRQVEEQQRRLSLLEDRERISMELHDGAIQSLYGVGLGIEAVGQVLETDPMLARTRLLQARDGLNQVIADIRAYIAGLHPEALEAGGLVATLTKLGRSVELNTLANCEVAVAVEADSTFGPETAQNIYQIAHEALSNVVRHAGATRAGLTLRRTHGSWELRIWDNGRGFHPEASDQAEAGGLRNMRARALRLGGAFRVSGGTDVATEVVVTLPAAHMY